MSETLIENVAQVLAPLVQKVIQRAIADERKACAKLALEWGADKEATVRLATRVIAERILARSLLSPTEVEK